MKKLDICFDFDGTLALHEYPHIGYPVPGMLELVEEVKANGHRIILLTMRGGNTLEEAVNWLKKRGIVFDAVNENPDQAEWTDSPKVFGHIYIDDAALGCPLLYPPKGQKPYVNAGEIRRMLEHKGVL